MSTMDKIKAKVDNMLHKDTSSDPTGPHDTHAANKADPRVDSDHYGATGNTSGAGGVGGGQYTSGHNTTGHSTTGHHTGHSTTGHTTGSGLTGTTGTHGSTGYSDPTGPHDSRLANKADPRVDSDRVGTAGNTSGAGGYGAGQYGESTGTGLTGHSTTGHGHHTGHHGTTGGGLSGTLGSTGYGDATGPHKTHTANVLDPRVDSDRVGPAGNTSGAGGIGGGQYTEGTTGHHGQHAGHHGQHGTTGGVGNTTGGYGGNNAGTGNAPKTAGPHSSDLMNKMDPRVDSDMDGSKTVGGNATYQ